MTDLDDYAALLNDELGIPVTTDQLGKGFDQIEGWDSVRLLSLVTLLERETGQSVSLPDVLEARSLRDVFELYTATAGA
jgi:acyl carrier protein